METIWSIKDCQLQRNDDILSLDVTVIFAIRLRFWKTFCNIFKILKYFMQYFESITIVFAILGNFIISIAILFRFCNTFLNTLKCYNTKALQYLTTLLQYNITANHSRWLCNTIFIIYTRFFYKASRLVSVLVSKTNVPCNFWTVDNSKKCWLIVISIH